VRFFSISTISLTVLDCSTYLNLWLLCSTTVHSRHTICLHFSQKYLVEKEWNTFSCIEATGKKIFDCKMPPKTYKFGLTNWIYIYSFSISLIAKFWSYDLVYWLKWKIPTWNHSTRSNLLQKLAHFRYYIAFSKPYLESWCSS
jgi:hypothetical protein